MIKKSLFILFTVSQFSIGADIYKWNIEFPDHTTAVIIADTCKLDGKQEYVFCSLQNEQVLNIKWETILHFKRGQEIQQQEGGDAFGSYMALSYMSKFGMIPF